MENLAVLEYVEAVLVFFTAILLVQPDFVFCLVPANLRSFARSTAKLSGFLLLGITFCWSILLGCALYLNSMVLRI